MDEKKSRKTIFFMGDVDDETTYKVISGIIELSLQPKNKKKEVNLILSSDGGDSCAGFAFYDTLRFLTDVSLKTVITGEVSSIGVIFALTSPYEKRFITPNGLLFLHEVTWIKPNGKTVSISDKEMRNIPSEYQEGLRRSQKTYIEIVAERTNLSGKKVLRMMKEKTYLSPEEAVRRNFASKIIQSSKDW